jgi:hypothetical protein
VRVFVEKNGNTENARRLLEPVIKSFIKIQKRMIFFAAAVINGHIYIYIYIYIYIMMQFWIHFWVVINFFSVRIATKLYFYNQICSRVEYLMHCVQTRFSIPVIALVYEMTLEYVNSSVRIARQQFRSKSRYGWMLEDKALPQSHVPSLAACNRKNSYNFSLDSG